MKKLFFILISLISISAFADLHNVQTIGQKNRNQAIGQGLQVGDSALIKGPLESDSDVHLFGLVHSVNGQTLVGDSAGHILQTACICLIPFRDSISSTQILNSNSIVDTLIPAPGVGYFIKPVGVNIYYHYATAAYTLAGTSGLFEGDLGASPIEASISSILTQTNDIYSFSYFSANQQGSFINKPLVYFSPISNPTDGGGYLIISGFYMAVKF